MVSFCSEFYVQSKHHFCCGAHFGKPGKIWPPEPLCAISSGARGWLQYRCMELCNTNLSVKLQTKLSFPLPQINFWQRRQLRTKLTKHGAAPAKGEVQASYFMLLTGQRLLAGLHFWLLDKLSHARYYFSTLPRKYGRISTIVSFWGPSGYPRYGSSCLETGKGTDTVWLLRSFAFLVFCHLQRIIYKPNGNYIYPVLYTALDY